eukprot:91416-Chlamydomonas_euryale.AAC.2
MLRCCCPCAPALAVVCSGSVKSWSIQPVSNPVQAPHHRVPCFRHARCTGMHPGRRLACSESVEI